MANSTRAKGLQFEICSISWDGENPQSVGVPETSLPPLNGDDGCASLDDVQLKSILQPKTNAIVNLKRKILRMRSKDQLDRQLTSFCH